MSEDTAPNIVYLPSRSTLVAEQHSEIEIIRNDITVMAVSTTLETSDTSRRAWHDVCASDELELDRTRLTGPDAKVRGLPGDGGANHPMSLGAARGQ